MSSKRKIIPPLPMTVYAHDVLLHNLIEPVVAQFLQGASTKAAVLAVFSSAHGYRLTEEQEKTLEVVIYEIVRLAGQRRITTGAAVTMYCDALAEIRANWENGRSI